MEQEIEKDELSDYSNAVINPANIYIQKAGVDFFLRWLFYTAVKKGNDLAELAESEYTARGSEDRRLANFVARSTVRQLEATISACLYYRLVATARLEYEKPFVVWYGAIPYSDLLDLVTCLADFEIRRNLADGGYLPYIYALSDLRAVIQDEKFVHGLGVTA